MIQRSRSVTNIGTQQSNRCSRCSMCTKPLLPRHTFVIMKFYANAYPRLTFSLSPSLWVISLRRWTPLSMLAQVFCLFPAPLGQVKHHEALNSHMVHWKLSPLSIFTTYTITVQAPEWRFLWRQRSSYPVLPPWLLCFLRIVYSPIFTHHYYLRPLLCFICWSSSSILHPPSPCLSIKVWYPTQTSHNMDSKTII